MKAYKHNTTGDIRLSAPTSKRLPDGRIVTGPAARSDWTEIVAEEQDVDVVLTKPANQWEAEQDARNDLRALIAVLQPTGDTRTPDEIIAQLQTQTPKQFKERVLARLSSLTAAKKEQMTLLFNTLNLAYQRHDKQGWDFRASHWGLSETYTVTERQLVEVA